MIFVDLENLRNSFWKIDYRRQPKFADFHFALFKFIIEKFNWEKHNPRLIRSYLYTGEYTGNLLGSIKQKILATESQREADILHEDYYSAKDNMEIQRELFDDLIGIPFVELKTTPLKHDIRKGIYQKGVDVLIAVDLLAHSNQDNYDVAIVCSGDLDLLESIKLVKNQGKKVIVVTHNKLIGKPMLKIADYFLNIDELSTDELDKISEIVEPEETER